MVTLPAMTPWRAVIGDYDFVMLHWGTTALEILKFPQLSPASGWFPELLPALTSPTAIFPWCALLLVWPLSWTQILGRLNFPSLCDITKLWQSHTFLFFRHRFWSLLQFTWHVDLFAPGCTFLPSLTDSCCGLLMVFFNLLIRFQLGLFSTSFMTFFFSQPSLHLIVLGTWEQPPNLLCQMFSLFVSVKPYFLKWSFCLTHDQSLKHCLPLERLFCGLFW